LLEAFPDPELRLCAIFRLGILNDQRQIFATGIPILSLKKLTLSQIKSDFCNFRTVWIFSDKLVELDPGQIIQPFLKETHAVIEISFFLDLRM
jgi:hypothetical protein